MKRLDVYNLYDKSEITDEEAAKALNMTLKTFRFRCTKWGHHLPLLLAILDKIKEDKITREEAAEALAVTVRGEPVDEVLEHLKTSEGVRP